MKIKTIILSITLPFYSIAFGNTDSISKHVQLETTTISSTRVSDQAPVSQITIQSSDIQKNGTVSQIPYLLQLTPSLVMTSENGTGSGNTQLRIRGVDASRINVSINGLPLNNPESQEVFWVNLPDLSSNLQSIQIQRGIGSSTNGTSAFGGSINLETQKLQSRAHSKVSTSIGSYGTFSTNIAAGTGLNKGFWLDAKYSKMLSDGYIRNGKIDHQAFFATTGYVDNKQIIKVNYMFGEQHTGITWEGSAMEDLEKDWRYNPSGIYYDEAGNIHYYDNETDNYFSNVIQAFYARNLSKNLSFNAGFNYTNGHGYYENYKTDRKFSSFGLPDQSIGSTLHEVSDVIRRKHMRNDYFAGNMYLQHQSDLLNLTGGFMLSYYTGDHFGRLPWIKYNQNIPENYEWYRNLGVKTDNNIFVKADYTLFEKFLLYGDLQYRWINYELSGMDDDLFDLGSTYNYNFFNPKFGLSYNISTAQNLYFSLAVGHREPTRSDLKESVKASEIIKLNSEQLFDYELGYRYNSERFALNANLYYMNYKDQLVPNGKLSESGYKLMDNVEKSYRAGIEISTNIVINKYFDFNANLTLSQNKIVEYIDQRAVLDPATWGFDHYEEVKYTNTDLAFSPNIIGAGILTFKPFSNFDISLTGKYVGKQYYDNTSNPDNQLDAYFVSNLNLAYRYNLSEYNKIGFEFFINNLFNKKYISNAWTYESHFTSGDPYVEKGFFAQAPIHFGFRVSFEF